MIKTNFCHIKKNHQMVNHNYDKSRNYEILYEIKSQNDHKIIKSDNYDKISNNFGFLW